MFHYLKKYTTKLPQSQPKTAPSFQTLQPCPKSTKKYKNNSKMWIHIIFINYIIHKQKLCYTTIPGSFFVLDFHLAL